MFYHIVLLYLSQNLIKIYIFFQACLVGHLKTYINVDKIL